MQLLKTGLGSFGLLVQLTAFATEQLNDGGWKKCRSLIDKRNQAHLDGLIISYWWNIWNERNRRIFSKETKNEVAFLIKEDLQRFNLATRTIFLQGS